MKKFLLCLTFILFVFTETLVQASVKGKPIEGEVYEKISAKELMPYIYKSTKDDSKELMNLLSCYERIA